MGKKFRSNSPLFVEMYLLLMAEIVLKLEEIEGGKIAGQRRAGGGNKILQKSLVSQYRSSYPGKCDGRTNMRRNQDAVYVWWKAKEKPRFWTNSLSNERIRATCQSTTPLLPVLEFAAR